MALIDEIKNIAKQYDIPIRFYKGKLTKNSKQDFEYRVDWNWVSINQTLSEDFIIAFYDKVNWYWVSMYQTLSEDFIRKSQHRVNWKSISRNQILSEGFIIEFQDKVCWDCISRCQILSEDFIREFQDNANWDLISKWQTLSEDFIREFKNIVSWDLISRYQTLSEDFIREFQDEVNWEWISLYQILSEKFIKEFYLTIPDTCWLYKSKEYKLEYIKNNTDYEIIDNKYIIAYKSVRKDNRSVCKPQAYLYEIGKEYESRCDYNIYEQNSFGLSAWAREYALDYYNRGNLLKVRIDIEDIGAIVHISNKIRCKKLTVLKEI